MNFWRRVSGVRENSMTGLSLSSIRWNLTLAMSVWKIWAVYAIWIASCNNFIWSPTLEAPSSHVEILYSHLQRRSRIFCIRYRRCSWICKIVIESSTFLNSFVMPLRIMTAILLMSLSKWILINSRIYFSIGCKINWSQLNPKL